MACFRFRPASGAGLLPALACFWFRPASRSGLLPAPVHLPLRPRGSLVRCGGSRCRASLRPLPAAPALPVYFTSGTPWPCRRRRVGGAAAGLGRDCTCSLRAAARGRACWSASTSFCRGWLCTQSGWKRPGKVWLLHCPAGPPPPRPEPSLQEPGAARGARGTLGRRWKGV